MLWLWISQPYSILELWNFRPRQGWHGESEGSNRLRPFTAQNTQRSVSVILPTAESPKHPCRCSDGSAKTPWPLAGSGLELVRGGANSSGRNFRGTWRLSFRSSASYTTHSAATDPAEDVIGVSGMKERIKQLKGEFKVTKPEPGTLVDPTAIWSWRLYRKSIPKCERWERSSS
jgi:hypothetical protein